MGTLKTVFQNNGVAAHAVSEHILPHRFSLRPYNRFLPESTEWWFFTPRGADSWPAYRFSKLFIQTFPPGLDTSSLMYAGLYVEKGFDLALSKMPGVKKAHVMQPDWYWHEFLDYACTGKYDQSMKELLSRSHGPIWISIDISEFNKPPEPDTERPPYYDMVQYTVKSEDLILHTERRGKKELGQLNPCASWPSISGQCKTFDSSG